MERSRRRRLAALFLGAIVAGFLLAWLAPQLALFALSGWVRAQTGRALVADSVTIEWGSTTTLDLTGLRLANARWAREPWMLAVDHLRVRAPLSALLRGQGVLTVVEVDGAALLLEVRGPQGNWQFADRPSPFISLGGGGIPRIDSLQLRDLRVRYHDPGREGDIIGAITGAAGNLGSPGWRIQGQGTLDFKALSFRLEGDGEVLNVAIDLGDTSLLARGSPADGRFHVHAEGADLRHAFPVIPVPFPSTPAYRFDAHVTRDGGRGWVAQQVTGRLGDTDLTGALRLVIDSPPRVEGTLRSRTLHLDDLKGFIGAPVRGPPPRPGKLFPPRPINPQRFTRIRLSLDYQADKVMGGGIPLERVATRVTIEAGLLRLAPFSIGVAKGTARGRAELDVRGAEPEAVVTLELRNARLGQLVAHVPMLDASRGRIRGTLQLRGRGASLAGIFGASHGDLVLLMTGGALDRRFVDALSGDLLRLLFGEDDGETAELDCAVAVFQVERGVARAEALVAETPQALITGKGRLDLRRERLDLTLAAAPREAKALTVPTPLTLAGTLADPRLEIDTTDLEGRAVAAVTLGALLGPLAAVAPLMEEGSDDDGGCGRVMRQNGRGG